MLPPLVEVGILDAPPPNGLLLVFIPNPPPNIGAVVVVDVDTGVDEGTAGLPNPPNPNEEGGALTTAALVAAEAEGVTLLPKPNEGEGCCC